MLTKFVVALFLLLLLPVCGAAQETTQPVAPVVPPIPQATVAYQPQFFLAGGAGFNKYSTPQAQGFMTFGVKLSDMNFTATNLIMTSKNASITQDFGRYLIQENNFTLSVLAGGGLASGEGSVGGSVGGGISLEYDISRYTKIPHTSAVTVVKVDKTFGADVKPTFLGGVKMSFGK